MSSESQLRALLKQYELVERDAVQEKLRIEQVVQQRQQRVEQLRRKLDELHSKLRAHETSGRVTAMKAGRAYEATSHVEWAGRLRIESQNLQAELADHEKDLQLAAERAKIAEDALSQARVDKKKVEKLQERRQLSADITEAALEEQSNDEESTVQRPRRGDI